MHSEYVGSSLLSTFLFIYISVLSHYILVIKSCTDVLQSNFCFLSLFLSLNVDFVFVSNEV